jgi:hypothetical protein
MASFADLLLTCEVPAVDLSGTLRDGTDDASGFRQVIWPTDRRQSWPQVMAVDGLIRSGSVAR